MPRSEVEMLRDRVEELEETVRQLREVLGADGFAFPPSWKLSPQETALLRSLYKSTDGFRTHDQLAYAIQRKEIVSQDHLKTVEHYVRKKVKPLGIEIATVWGKGVRLTGDSKAIIDRALAA